MGKVLELPKPQIDGQDVEVDAVDELLSESELLSFEYERDGKTLTFHALVDGALITVDDLNEYQTAFAAVMAEAEEKEAQAEKAKAPQNRKQARKNRKAQEQSVESEDDGIDAETYAILTTVGGLMARLAQLEAQLLHKAIVGWNVPNLEPTASVLCARTGPGSSARAAVKDWFFPMFPAPEAETGMSETPSTPATSAI